MSRKPVIAVIDDDESFRLALAQLLESLDYGALDFASAEAFVASPAVDTVDCIVTDIHMPGMSGIDLQQRLVARGSTIPLIMVTARAEPGLEARMTAIGALCLLLKPFEPAALLACLDRALGG